MLRPIFFVAVFSAVFGLSRGIASFLRLFLRQDSGEALISAAVRNVSVGELLWPALGWSALGTGVAFGLAVVGERFTERTRAEITSELCRPYLTLVIPAGLTLLAAGSLIVSPSYPHGANLAVSLALEGSFPSLLTMLLFGGTLLHTAVRVLGPSERRLPGVAIVVLAMVCFLVATPGRFYEEGVGQGNMFKYVRMAAAVSGTGTLDIERADENPDPTFGEFLSRLPAVAGSYARASVEMIAGSGIENENENEATRVNRSMFRGVDGGAYYINAPGPGLLLVPAYLLDQSLNRMLGTERQIAIILFWQLLGALLVYEIAASVGELTRRSPGTVTGFAIALAVPFLFYTFQIYPELPGGLFLLVAFRRLILDPMPSTRAVVVASLALAVLPWLHQKYSVVAAVLGVLGALKLLGRTPGGVTHHPYKVVVLALPLAVSAYSIFLYNYTLTGSLSPTATFSAAGRSSFEPWNFPKGLSGLLLDRENGLFIFAPIYTLALVGIQVFFLRHHRIFTPFVLVVVSYLFVIASFPYWPGAVSTMGRYILSILPLLALPMALVVERAFADGVLAGVGLTLLAGSLSVSASFVRDLVPSYQPMMFWQRILYSDPVQYLPTFLSDGILGSGPVHFVKFLVLVLLVASLVYFLRDRVREEPFSLEAEADVFHRRLCLGAAGLLAAVVGAGALLEHWPGNASDKLGPTFRETRELRGGRTLAVFGEHGFEGPGAWVAGGGTTEFLLSSKEELPELTLRLRNGPRENTVVFEERGETKERREVPPSGPHDETYALRNPYRFYGPKGERYVYRFEVHSEEGFVPRDEGTSDDARELGIYVRVR